MLDARAPSLRRIGPAIPATVGVLVAVSLFISASAPVSAVSLVAPPAPPLPAPTTTSAPPPVPHVTEVSNPDDVALSAIAPTAPTGDDPTAPATETDSSTPDAAGASSVSATAGAVESSSGTAAATAGFDPLVRAAARRAVVNPGEVPRILVVGDSAALTLGDGLSRWATDTGRAQVWDAGSLGCAIARGGTHRYVNYRPEGSPANCERWATVRAEQVASIQPHLVVVMSGTWDVVDRKLAGSDVWTHLGNPDADAYFASELRAFLDVAAAGGATVVWLDHPAIRSGVKEGLDGPFPESDPARIDRLNAIATTVAASRDDTAVVDVRSFLRDQPGGELDPVRRPDGIHWSRDAGRQDAEWLGPVLLSLVDHPTASTSP